MKNLLTLSLLFIAALGYAQPVGNAPKIFTYSDVRYFLGQKKLYNNLVFDQGRGDTAHRVNQPVIDSLVEFLKDKKNMVVEIGSHVLDMGDSTFNVNYSLGLAQAVKSYLESKGIAADRLIAKGWGSTQPIISHIDGEKYNDSNDLLNRRIEVKIVDFIDPVLTYKTTRFFTGQKMIIKLRYEDTILDLDTIVKLATFFKANNLKIEIGIHTDARLTKEQNLDNSQKKANELKSLLVSRGADEAMLVPVGYGEKYVINRCARGVKCTEEEHSQNRRVEFTILPANK